MKPPKTLLRLVLGMGLALAATTTAAQAAPLRVAVTANFALAPLIAVPGTLSLAFDLAEPIPGVIPEGDVSFRLENIAIDASFDGSAVTSAFNQVGWFNYADSSYFGVDVRLRDLLAPGDLMQMILLTPQVLFSGATSAPTLDRVSLSNLLGVIYYYEPGSFNVTFDGPLSEATYEVSAVPEPAAALMMSLGLALIATVRRRRQRV